MPDGRGVIVVKTVRFDIFVVGFFSASLLYVNQGRICNLEVR